MLYVVPTFILGIATADDLLKKKVHNWLFLTCLAIALGHVFYFHGFGGLTNALISGGLAFLLTFPLFVIRALGGGDVKIFLAFGVATNFNIVLTVFLYALFWGSFLGILMIIFNKGFKNFIRNLISIITFKTAPRETLHKIPYTFALLCGWISYLITNQFSGRFL